MLSTSWVNSFLNLSCHISRLYVIFLATWRTILVKVYSIQQLPFTSKIAGLFRCRLGFLCWHTKVHHCFLYLHWRITHILESKETIHSFTILSWAEYRALAAIISEILWINQLLKDFLITGILLLSFSVITRWPFKLQPIPSSMSELNTLKYIATSYVKKLRREWLNFF